MNAPRAGIPLRPDRDAIAEMTVAALVRSCIAVAHNAFEGAIPASEFARRRWGDEARAVDYVLRGASAPAARRKRESVS